METEVFHHLFTYYCLLFLEEAITGFSGCMKNLHLHNTLLPLEGSTTIISKVTKNLLQNGCTDSGICAYKHCPSFSNCVNTFTAYKCVCLPGHHGKLDGILMVSCSLFSLLADSTVTLVL